MSEALMVDIRAKAFTINGAALPVVRDLSFYIQPGQFVALIGPSGCGKTTILRIILGLDTDYDGRIELSGTAINGPGVDRGIVFQEPRLLPWMTTRENIEFAAREDPATPRMLEHISQLVAMTGLAGFEEAWPGQLSGGMAQRAALARALVNVPALLLLDEPLGALDSYTRLRLQEAVARIHAEEQTTTLMVTHDVDEAVFLSDAIVVLTPRPCRVSTVIPVDIPRPRDRFRAEFLELRSRTLAELYG
jgi:ABC-type nitrate/sulfonate/bicarbonate transport system ATPase subunit